MVVLLLVWADAPVLILSRFRSRLPFYVLPVFPPWRSSPRAPSSRGCSFLPGGFPVPGTGLILEVDVETGDRVELVSFTQ